MFILAPERDEDTEGAFSRYSEYIRRESSRFPPGALALATSDWYYSFADHRAPHDAWLLSTALEEAGTSARRENRALSLRIRLLGAYHDRELEFFYPRVFAYALQGQTVARGHGDWRYDELRLDPTGRLIHEIQWNFSSISATWMILADDVAFTWREVSSATPQGR